ncbi:MAG: MarR family winged helix-turn-helix transcriptional regulator [Gammaproteobacteria bacterium]
MTKQPDAPFKPSDEFVRAFQRLVGEVFRLNGQLLNTADLLSKDLDVSTARWQTMAVIRYAPITVAAISRRLGLSRQSVQQTVNRLEKQGVVEFADNPDHRTSPLVKLTPHGKEIMRILVERQAELTAHFTDGLGYDLQALQRLTDELRRMREHARQVDALEIMRNKRED